MGGKPVGVMKAVPLARCGESPPRGGGGASSTIPKDNKKVSFI